LVRSQEPEIRILGFGGNIDKVNRLAHAAKAFDYEIKDIQSVEQTVRIKNKDGKTSNRVISGLLITLKRIREE